MSDNLKDLKEVQVDFAIPLAGGVASVKTVNHNPLEKEIISKLGRYTGFPFSSQRIPTLGIVPNGSLFWNANAMNKNDFQFSISISKNTLDGNYISRILELLVEGDLIHFKDFVGRSTTLKFIGMSEQIDGNSNVYYDVLVEGFAENTNYAYQVGEIEPCMIEFIKNTNNQNNKIIYTELYSDYSGTLIEQLVLVINDTGGFVVLENEIQIFLITDSETNDTSQFIFKEGKGIWGNLGDAVVDNNFIEILQYKKTPIKSITSPITIFQNDKTINISSGTFTQPLITAVGNAGIEFEFINSGSGIVTLDANGTQTINSALTLIVPAESGYKIKSDGANWIITSKFRQQALNRTQWVQPISTTTIANASSLNLLTLISDANKNVNGTDGGIYELSVATNKILTPWKGSVMIHNIRVLMTIATGTDQHYALTLRRFSDNSIVSSTQLNRNSDTGINSADFLTYTYSASDPFVTDGFYFQIDNNSGASVDLITNINLLISTSFR